jgi:hypothetical protein
MPEFETYIFLHNMGLAHLDMSIVCSNSSVVVDDVLSVKALQHQNRAYLCLRKSFILLAKTISDRTTIATTTASIQLLHCYDMSLRYRSMILFLHNIFQMFNACSYYDTNDSHRHDNQWYQNERDHYTAAFDHIVRKLSILKQWHDKLGLRSAAAGAA